MIFVMTLSRIVCYLLADNASMKAYMGSGFTPLVVQRNKALYSAIVCIPNGNLK
jgi:hypothetical protein